MQSRAILFIFLFLITLCSYAQDRSVLVVKPKTNQQETDSRLPKKSKEKDRQELFTHTLTVGYLQNELKEKDYYNLKSYIGFNTSYGQMFPLNTSPSAWNYGIDVVYVSLNYMNYKLRFHEEGNIKTLQWHQAEAGVQLGMALIIVPVQDFNIKVYARYAPTYSGLFADCKLHSSYGNYFIAGFTANIKRVGIGADFRIGTCNYKDLSYTGEFKNIGVGLYASINF